MPNKFQAFAKRFVFGGASIGLTRPQSTSIRQAQGTRSWRHSGGFVFSYEKNPLLTRYKKYETYSEMMANHATIGAGIRAFLSVIQKTEWSIEPLEGNANSQSHAEDIRVILDSMETKLPQIMRRSAMYVYYGFGLQEWIAKPLPSGIIGIKDIEPRAQHTIYRWDITPRGDIKGVEQQDYVHGGEFYIDRRRLIYCVDDSLHDSPEGFGLFRQMFTTASRLDSYLTLEDIGFDTDLRGVPVVKVPLERLGRMVESGELSKEEAEGIIGEFTSFIEEHQRKKSQGLMVDSEPYLDNEGTPTNVPQYEVDLLKGDGSAQADLSSAINRLRSELSMLMGTAFLMLGEGGGGSLALSKTKMDAFMLLVGSTLQYLATVYERDLFKQIARLNGWDEQDLPKFKYEEPKMQDIMEITESLRNMATAGAVLQKDDPIWDELRGMMGLQQRPDDLEFPEDDVDLFPGAVGAQGGASLNPKEGE